MRRVKFIYSVSLRKSDLHAQGVAESSLTSPKIKSNFWSDFPVWHLKHHPPARTLHWPPALHDHPLLVWSLFSTACTRFLSDTGELRRPRASLKCRHRWGACLGRGLRGQRHSLLGDFGVYVLDQFTVTWLGTSPYLNDHRACQQDWSTEVGDVAGRDAPRSQSWLRHCPSPPGTLSVKSQFPHLHVFKNRCALPLGLLGGPKDSAQWQAQRAHSGISCQQIISGTRNHTIHFTPHIPPHVSHSSMNVTFQKMESLMHSLCQGSGRGADLEHHQVVVVTLDLKEVGQSHHASLKVRIVDYERLNVETYSPASI